VASRLFEAVLMVIAAVSGWTSEQKHVVAASFLGWSLDAVDSSISWSASPQRRSFPAFPKVSSALP